MDTSSPLYIFIYKLLFRLKNQLDLPKSKDLNIILETLFSNQLLENLCRETQIDSKKKLEKFIQPLEFYFQDNPVIGKEFLTLIQALLLYTTVHWPLSPESVERCFEYLQVLRQRRDFELEFVLGYVNNHIMQAVTICEDLVLQRMWLERIKTIEMIFAFDVSGLIDWFVSRVTQIIFTALQRVNEEEIKFFIAYVQELIEQKFDLQNLKTIVIDTALYMINSKIMNQDLQGISFILGAIKRAGIVPSLQPTFEKYEKKYGTTESKNKPKPQTEFVFTYDLLEIYEKRPKNNIYLKDCEYSVRICFAKIKNSNIHVVIKLYSSYSEKTMLKFEQEKNILQTLSGKKGFLIYYGSYMKTKLSREIGEPRFQLGIVMEKCPKVLKDDIDKRRILKRPFSEEELKSISLSLISGFSLMSQCNPKIYHQDIKPDNIYFNNSNEIVIADFNVSTIKESHELTTQGNISGTLAYMAPEIREMHLSRQSGKFRRSKVDVYSLGVTLYQLYTLDPQTFNTPQDFPKRNKRIAECPYPWLRSILTDCLQANYKLRPDFKNLLMHLSESTIVN